MKKMSTFMGCFALVIQCFSQGVQKPVSSIFSELGGNGGLLSLNYDRRFSKGNDGFGWKAGLGIGGTPSGHSFSVTPTVPVGLNYLLEKGAHHLEAGAGVTFGFEKFGPSGDGISSVFFVPSLGYRFQRTKGFVFRLFACPFLGSKTEFSGGLSFGSSF